MFHSMRLSHIQISNTLLWLLLACGKAFYCCAHAVHVTRVKARPILGNVSCMTQLKTVFEITFKANQTFGLTGSEISQSEPKLARPKPFFYHRKCCNK